MKRVRLHVQVYEAFPDEKLCHVREGAGLLLENGWELKDRTWSNWVLRPPEGADMVYPVVDAIVPDGNEVLELARKLHAKGSPWRGRAFGWNAEYSASQGRIVAGRPSRKVSFPAYFFIGELGLWMMTFRWEDGDELPPRLITDTSCIVKRCGRVFLDRIQQNSLL